MSRTITGEQAKIIELEVALANLAQYEKERDYFKQENERLKEENRNLKNELEVYKYEEAERRQEQIKKQKETEEAQKFQFDCMFSTVVWLFVSATIAFLILYFPDWNLYKHGFIKIFIIDIVLLALYVVHLVRRKKGGAR